MRSLTAKAFLPLKKKRMQAGENGERNGNWKARSRELRDPQSSSVVTAGSRSGVHASVGRVNLSPGASSGGHAGEYEKSEIDVVAEKLGLCSLLREITLSHSDSRQVRTDRATVIEGKRWRRGRRRTIDHALRCEHLDEVQEGDGAQRAFFELRSEGVTPERALAFAARCCGVVGTIRG